MAAWILLLSFAHFFSGCEACSKFFTFTGKVTDSKGNAVSGVKVSFTSKETTTTDDSGSYKLEVYSLGGLNGSVLTFTKDGYQETTSTAFTKDEAGINRCGSISLARDVTLNQ